ncbi:hypothetical protein CW304_18265 [Bacillus sp. UFRGS-B20]|nr:hypothetical protein CW304_18265 [Bacillus sp. UFRGS-B20]
MFNWFLSWNFKPHYDPIICTAWKSCLDNFHHCHLDMHIRPKSHSLEKLSGASFSTFSDLDIPVSVNISAFFSEFNITLLLLANI